MVERVFSGVTILKSAVVAASIAFSATGAQAISIECTALSGSDTNAANLPAMLNPIASSTSGTVFQNTTTSLRGVRLSPWSGGDQNGSAAYTSISGNASATYTYAEDQIAFSLLWGSPDTYIVLDLRLDGDLFSTVGVGGMSLITAGGGKWFEVSDTLFVELVFRSNTNAFEFANFSTEAAMSPIPLPAGGVLLLTGLGALIARRKLG